MVSGLSRDSPDSHVSCRPARSAELMNHPDNLMPRGNHSVKARASHDSSSVLVRAGDHSEEPAEHLVSASIGSREPVQWSRFLRVSEEKCFLQPDMDLQDAVRLSSVLKQLPDMQDAAASKELSSEQSVAFSLSAGECSVCCSEVPAHVQDAVSKQYRSCPKWF